MAPHRHGLSSRFLALFQLVSLISLTASQAQVGTQSAVHFDVDATQGNHTDYALGAFIESNINRSDDGGLYGELIQNRAFQEPNSYLTLTGWVQVGNIAIQQDNNNPLSEALPQSLQVFVRQNSTASSGQVAGLYNTGWWGIPVSPQTYQFSMFIKNDPKSPLQGSVHVSLSSRTTNQTFASVSFPASQVPSDGSWTQLKATLKPTQSAPDSNNVLNVMLDVMPNHNNNAWINLVSLFPETFKGRTNGARKDIAEALNGLQPKYVRIPGGSDLQGETIPLRYNWSATIGPLQNRPGRSGLWTGWQTEGLGLMELLEFIEDIGSKPILGIYAAYSSNDESIPDNEQLDPFIQDAVNELQFLMGDPKTNKFAKMRADLGRTQPFDIPFVELGNEDFTSKTYDYRWARYTTALKAAFPKVNYVATTTLPGVKLDWVDIHDYSGPDFFYNKFSKYDNWPRNTTKIVELEEAVISTDSINPFGNPPARLLLPTLQGAIAEGVTQIGLQRNGDLVVTSSYAPYLQNVNSVQWTPNLILYNVNETVLSTSYYVQQMVSLARSDTVHPVLTTTNFKPLYWVASSSSNKTFFFQIANIDQPGFNLSGTIKLPSRAGNKLKTATITSLTSDNMTISNSLDSPMNCVPVTSNLKASVAASGNADRGANQVLTFSGMLPKWSFNVLKFEME